MAIYIVESLQDVIDCFLLLLQALIEILFQYLVPRQNAMLELFAGGRDSIVHILFKRLGFFRGVRGF